MTTFFHAILVFAGSLMAVFWFLMAISGIIRGEVWFAFLCFWMFVWTGAGAHTAVQEVLSVLRRPRP